MTFSCQSNLQLFARIATQPFATSGAIGSPPTTMSRFASFDRHPIFRDPQFRVGRLPPFTRQELLSVPDDCERKPAPTPTVNAKCLHCRRDVPPGQFVCDLDCARVLRVQQAGRQLYSVPVSHCAL